MALAPVNTTLNVAQDEVDDKLNMNKAALSAIAEVFTPTPGLYSAFPQSVAGHLRSPVRDLLTDSSPDSTVPSSPDGVELTKSQYPGVIGSGGPTKSINPMLYNAGVFTNEAGLSTRAFLVHGFSSGPHAARMIGTIFKVR